MARWQPNAPERLALAALELFEERGYEATTVIEIAERAGLTKSTFFRHFRDKREVLFGGGAVNELLTASIVEAPPTSTPLEAASRAFDAMAAGPFSAERRAFSARRREVIAAHPELREREALKGLALTAGMTDALMQRGVGELAARVTAELSALAMGIAYARWSDPANNDDFGALARDTLKAVREAASTSD